MQTKEMSKREWLAARRLGIGGSDVATILGLNKYKTAFELWLDKTGQLPIDDSETSEAAYWGNTLEEAVAKEFERRTDKKVRKRNKMFYHPEHQFLTANIDRDIVKENAILECKTASAFLSKNWEGDEIPEQYICQVQHYMNVLNRDYAYIAVLVGGQKFIWKKIERDQELIDLIEAACIEFWEVNVMKEIPPAIDGSEAATNYIKETYPDNEEGKQVQLGREFDEFISSKNELMTSQKVIRQSINEIDNLIKVKLGEDNAEIGITQHNLISWKKQRKTSLNSKLLQERYPEVYDECLNVSEYKVLRIKEITK